MAMSKESLSDIYLYINNHKISDGIEDYISILTGIFSSNGHNLELTSDLTKINSTFLIIDEFTNYFSNKEIRKIDKSSKVIFIATEFIEKKALFETFNYYSGIDRYFYTPFLNLYLKMKRSDFGKINLRDKLSALVAILPALLILSLKFIHYVLKKKNIYGFLEKEKQYMQYFIYLHMRYLGFCSMIDMADMVIVSHKNVGIQLEASRNCRTTKKIFEFVPDFSKKDFNSFFKRRKKNIGIMLTGSITPYRQKWIEKINREIQIFGLFDIVYVKAYSFEDKRRNSEIFSLHPVQIKGWKYSSPTRIYRSIVNDNTIPIVTQKNNDHIIENLCYQLDLDRIYDLISLVNSEENAQKYWIEKIKNYQAEAEKMNTKMIDAIADL